MTELAEINDYENLTANIPVGIEKLVVVYDKEAEVLNINQKFLS